MAKHTFFADGTREIGVGLIFVAGREIVSLAALVKRDWRLEKVAADIHEISTGVIAGADDPINVVFTLVAAIFPALPVAGGRRVHGDFRAVRADGAIWFLSGAA